MDSSSSSSSPPRRREHLHLGLQVRELLGIAHLPRIHPLLLSLQLLLQHGDLLFESILNAGNIVSVARSHDHIGGELFKLLLELVEPGSLG